MRRRATTIALCTVMLLAICAPPTFALPDEYLFCDPPRGWDIATSKATAKTAFVEIIPDGEKTNRWSQIITIQTFFGRSDILPSQWCEGFQAQMREACSSLSFSKVTIFRDNGFSAARMMMHCPDLTDCERIPENLRKHKGEITYIKVIRGLNHFYVIQRAWRGEPFEDPSASEMPKRLMMEWMKFFEGVQVHPAK
ncbi:MAG: hypothetical protein NTV99_06350 [Deltaproteobacteria bacterium]|nr:hypothetical protein [Deltaproteobacteria bacterium]